jgi:phage terminase large subunit-like protein
VREAEHPGYLGTGLIPKSLLHDRSCSRPWHDGCLCERCRKAYLGGYSTLAFKSYEQGWQKFQGDGVSFIWLDEEPDDFKVYTECQARLLATGGSMMITFTPLLGETELYQSFARGDDPDKGFVNMTGDDVIAEPHGHLQQESYDRAISSASPLTNKLPVGLAARSWDQVQSSRSCGESSRSHRLRNLSAIGASDGASILVVWVALQQEIQPPIRCGTRLLRSDH